MLPATRGRAAAAGGLLMAATLASAPVAPLAGQVVEPREPVERTEVGGRVHLQLNTSSVDRDATGDDLPDSEFLLRRARIWAGVRVNDWIDGAAQVDFSGGRASARYAFMRISLDPALRLSFGQFKRAFDLFELTSSSQILVIERDGEVRGVDACAGVGGVCSYSRLTEGLELSSLDVGVLAYGDLADGRAAYSVSLTNGAGGNTLEDNDGKSASGRFEVDVVPGVRLAGNAALHDFTEAATGQVRYAPAGAVDVEWGSFEGGWHVQAGVLTGENWRNPGPDGEGSTFRAGQIIVTHRFVTGDAASPAERTGSRADGGAAGPRVLGVEPVLRLSVADPDTGDGTGPGRLWTPGLVVHFEGRNKIAANVDVWDPARGDGAWSLKVQTYLHF